MGCMHQKINKRNVNILGYLPCVGDFDTALHWVFDPVRTTLPVDQLQ